MADYTQGTSGAANTLTGDQVIVEVQEILQTEGFGLFQLFARPSQQNGFTFTYKTPERLVPEAYDRTGNAALGKGGIVPQVDITANEVDVVYFEIEDTEFASQVLADAEKTRLANSMVQSMMAQLDAEILDTLKTTVEADTTKGKVSTVGFTVAKSQDGLADCRLLLGDVIADNESLIDAKTLGVPSVRQILIMSPKSYWRYINSFDTNVLAQSNEIKVGSLTIKEINGALVIKHPLLGSAHAAKTLHKTKAYDFSKITIGSDSKPLEGFVVTDIAAAIPFALNKTSTRINKFGNEEIIMRYKYGKDAIRPGLIKAVLSEAL